MMAFWTGENIQEEPVQKIPGSDLPRSGGGSGADVEAKKQPTANSFIHFDLDVKSATIDAFTVSDFGFRGACSPAGTNVDIRITSGPSTAEIPASCDANGRWATNFDFSMFADGSITISAALDLMNVSEEITISKSSESPEIRTVAGEGRVRLEYSVPASTVHLSITRTNLATVETVSVSCPLDANECEDPNLVSGDLYEYRLSVTNSNARALSANAVQALPQSLATGHHSCYVNAGNLYCWGDNSAGAIDRSIADSYIVSPRKILSTGDISKVVVGANQTCVLKRSQELLCWGDNGTYGVGYSDDTVSVALSSAVQLFAPGSGVTDIALGAGGHGCAVRDGGVECWGAGTYGQSGPMQILQNRAELNLVIPVHSGVTRVAAGLFHTCALVNGNVNCWGSNTSGQLGLDPSQYSMSALPVSVAQATQMTELVAGDSFTCGLKDNAPYCWGSSGQLTSGSATSAFPVQLTSMGTSVTSLAAGAGHLCAISDGGIRCVGEGLAGQLGDGTANSTSTAVQTVAPGSRATRVAAGYNTTCAIVSGSLYCWGENLYGQLGDSTVADNADALKAPITSDFAAMPSVTRTESSAP